MQQQGQLAKEKKEEETVKNCAPFTDCISKINHTQADNAKEHDAVMPIYNLREYSDNYSKTSGSYREEQNATIIDSESFKFKARIKGCTPAAGNTNDVEIAVPLKCLINFCKFLKQHK